MISLIYIDKKDILGENLTKDTIDFKNDTTVYCMKTATLLKFFECILNIYVQKYRRK